MKYEINIRVWIVSYFIKIDRNKIPDLPLPKYDPRVQTATKPARNLRTPIYSHHLHEFHHSPNTSSPQERHTRPVAAAYSRYCRRPFDKQFTSPSSGIQPVPGRRCVTTSAGNFLGRTSLPRQPFREGWSNNRISRPENYRAHAISLRILFRSGATRLASTSYRKRQ